MNTRTPPPGGDTRLSGEVEEVCARLEQRCGRGSVEHEAADLLRQLAADNATRKALCEEAIELGKSYQSRLQACEAERDRLKAAVRLWDTALTYDGQQRKYRWNTRNLDRAFEATRQALKDNDHE
jgi:hypothetical protein